MTLLAITRSGARSPAELAPWMAGNIELVGISYGLASDAWMTNARVIATAIGRIRSFTNLRMVPMPPLADRRDRGDAPRLHTCRLPVARYPRPPGCRSPPRAGRHPC